MKFSVIIPAYNEAKYIKSAIEALKNQTIPRHHFEIIVVDNNSKDGTSKIARRAGADKVVFEHHQGTNLARQKGFEISGGKIVAFLDADCVPPPQWLEKIKYLLTSKNCVAVTGPYDYGFRGAKKIAEQAYFDAAFRLVPKTLFACFGKKAAAIMGGNFASYRSTIKKIGGLPPVTFFGDDTAIALLIARRVGKVCFSPALTVKSSPRRFRKGGLAKTTLKYAKHYFKAYFELPPK